MTPGTAATARCSRSMTVVTVVLRWSRERSVMASRPAFGVALIGVTPMTETTPVTSGSLRIAVSTSACSRFISAERDLLPAFHHREDEAGVLQRQEALRNDDVEPDGRDQRGRRSPAA